MFSDVWSENTAPFESLMEIHSNPPSAGDGCRNCSFSDKKIILGSIILQTILIIFRGGAIEYLVFLGNGC